MFNSDQRYIDSCPIGCQAGFEDSAIVLPEGPLKRCLACGQLLSPCSEEQYWNSMKEFEDPKGTWPSGQAVLRLARHTKQILSRIESLLDKRQGEIQLLDVGCSSGSFIAAASILGVKAVGVEPAAAPARTAIESGLEVYQGFLQDVQFPRESFDAVTLFEVLEHLKEPLSLLRECHRVLRPQGLVIIRTGNTESWTAHYMKARWEYFHLAQHGGHISFYNPASMRKLAERAGFTIENLKTHRVSFYHKNEISIIPYRLAKLFSELLNIPSRWLGKGHEIITYLRRTQSLPPH